MDTLNDVASVRCASVWRRSSTFRHQRNIFCVPLSRRSLNKFIVFDGFWAIFKTLMPFVKLGSRNGQEGRGERFGDQGGVDISVSARLRLKHIVIEAAGGFFHGGVFLEWSEASSNPAVRVSDHGRHVMSSTPVPHKTHRVGERCTLNASRAQTSSRWCSVVVRRGDAGSGVVHIT
ncbi:hypothetical protein TNCV_1004641 [Trichonephila clavipes]|nr:hypothetical protein TNCV_1004641 [Trichonephila clavipes]